jgi:hypothetical protein
VEKVILNQENCVEAALYTHCFILGSRDTLKMGCCVDRRLWLAFLLPKVRIICLKTFIHDDLDETIRRLQD